jgi:hypothetical protein
VTAACHEPGNGTKPRCVRDSDFDAINGRLDSLDERTGEMMREAVEARAEAQAAHAIGRKVLDEVLGMRGEMREAEDRRNRECDIRHRPIERRLDRLEDHDDTLTATSAVTYSDEALRRRYEERKSEIAGLQVRLDSVEQSLSKESKAKASAVEAEAVARARARAALWGAAGAIAMAVASAVVAALQTWR